MDPYSFLPWMVFVQIYEFARQMYYLGSD